MKAATYSRYSSDQQRESSIDDQLRNTHERAKREGWRVVANFADRAVSDSDNNRPQYLAMLTAARRKEFDALILDDLSRLTRDSLEQETVIRDLEFAGIRIVTTGDGYDSDSKSAKLHRGFKGMMNEQFIDQLRQQVRRGQKGQAIKKCWNGGKPYGYKLKRVTDPKSLDQYGEPARIGTMLEVDPTQAKIVREIFKSFAAGESAAGIAHALNARGIASPGSTWKRKTRRCKSWVNSAVRTILLNPLYTGQQRWNVSQFVQHPKTHTDIRRLRPESEWVVNEIPALRIIPDALFASVRGRMRKRANSDAKLKRGGKAKFPLSGLLVCSECGRNFVIADARAYACGSYISGGVHACGNAERVRRDELEDKIIGMERARLRDPQLMQKVVKAMGAEHARRAAAGAAKAEAAPRELVALDARIARLQARLAAGDPDLEPDELVAAIDKATHKRHELLSTQPAPKLSATVLGALPGAAKAYLARIDQGAILARDLWRDYLGPIKLTPGDKRKGELLWASWRSNPAALLKCRDGGRGDRI
jgi:site-specific DNA recombinase